MSSAWDATAMGAIRKGHSALSIAIDGFALGLAQGTGIARYAIELSKTLAGQHRVVPLYGLTGVRRDQLGWSTFIQSLILRGEAGSRDLWRWVPHCALYAPKYLLGLPVRARRVAIDQGVDTSSVATRLPAFSSVYNAPSIYRSAQAYAHLCRRSLRVAVSEPVNIWHLTMPLPVLMRGARTVVTAHDVVPIALPHSTPVDIKSWRQIAWQSFRAADMIFAVSEYTKRDVLAQFDIPEHKVFVTHQTVDIPRRIIDTPQEIVARFLHKTYRLQYGSYLLFYGAIEPKKNVQRIIEAMCTADTKMPLVVAGKSGWLDHEVNALIARLHSRPETRRSVIRIDYLPYDQLMFLVRGARALVFPSLYEGFGIPLLEAMTLECPVITSNTTSCREIAGDAALYVSPTKTYEIARAVEELASNDNLRGTLVMRGKARARDFAPASYLAKLEEGYRLALQKT